MQSLLKHRAHDFVYDGLKIKMNTQIIIIEYENGDKMYYKLTQINTIRYLGGFIERKKNRANSPLNEPVILRYLFKTTN